MHAGMRVAVVSSAVGILALVSVLAAAAGSVPAIKTNPADQAAAQAAMIRLGDLRPSGAWKGGAVKPTHTPVVCPNFNPKQSDLVVTGEAQSQWGSSGALVTASTDVLRSSSMVRLDWQRSMKKAGFVCALNSGGAVNISTSEVAVPKLTPWTSAFRATYEPKFSASSTRLVVELVAVGSGRSEITVAEFRAMPTSLSDLHADVVRMARLMLSRAKV